MNGEARATAGHRRAQADHAQGLRNPAAYAQARVLVFREGRAAEEELANSTRGRLDQIEEHRAAVVAAVVTPRVLVQVALQPLDRHGVIDTPDTVLEQGEEPLDCLRVDVPAHVDAGGMVDSLPVVDALDPGVALEV